VTLGQLFFNFAIAKIEKKLFDAAAQWLRSQPS
jgi:hypothetical protein